VRFTRSRIDGCGNAFRRSASLCSSDEGKTKQTLSAVAGERFDSVDLNTSRKNAARQRESFAWVKSLTSSLWGEISAGVAAGVPDVQQ
jgi:hypothetical protein